MFACAISGNGDGRLPVFLGVGGCAFRGSVAIARSMIEPPHYRLDAPRPNPSQTKSISAPAPLRLSSSLEPRQTPPQLRECSPLFVDGHQSCTFFGSQTRLGPNSPPPRPSRATRRGSRSVIERRYCTIAFLTATRRASAFRRAQTIRYHRGTHFLRTWLPPHCTRPSPAKTINVWPSGCVATRYARRARR